MNKGNFVSLFDTISWSLVTRRQVKRHKSSKRGNVKANKEMKVEGEGRRKSIVVKGVSSTGSFSESRA